MNWLYLFLFGSPKRFVATLCIAIVLGLAAIVEVEFPGALGAMKDFLSSENFRRMLPPLSVLLVIFAGVVLLILGEFDMYNKKRRRG